MRLTHTRIARTYGVFEDRGTYYLAMEYLPGGSLADKLEPGPLSVEEAVRVASDLCEALAYAHERGVVHCDIKPANVLFDETGDVRLADSDHPRYTHANPDRYAISEPCRRAHKHVDASFHSYLVPRTDDEWFDSLLQSGVLHRD